MANQIFYPAYNYFKEPIESNFELIINPLLNDLGHKITVDQLTAYLEDKFSSDLPFISSVVTDGVTITGTGTNDDPLVVTPVGVGDSNIGNTNLTLTANRTLNLANFYLEITTGNYFSVVTTNSINFRTTTVSLLNKTPIRFYDVNNTNYTQFSVVNNLVNDINYTLPTVQGTADQVLSNDGLGNLFWADNTHINLFTDNLILQTNRQHDLDNYDFSFFRGNFSILQLMLSQSQSLMSYNESFLNITTSKFNIGVDNSTLEDQFLFTGTDFSLIDDSLNGKKTLSLWNNFSNGYVVRLTTRDNVDTDTVYQLPNDGNPNQILQTDGSGKLSWVNLPSSGITQLVNIDLSSTLFLSSNTKENNITPLNWPVNTSLNNEVTKIINISPSTTNKIQIISGLTSGTSTKIVTLRNISSDQLVILENNSTSSLPQNRFKFTSRGAYFLLPGDEVTMLHNGTQWSQFSFTSIGGLDYFDDFLAANDTLNTTSYIGSVGIATGSGAGVLAMNGATSNGLGTLQLATGTTTSGWSKYRTNARSGLGTGVNGSGLLSGTTSYAPYVLVSKFQLDVAPTIGENYQAVFGNGSNALLGGVSITGLQGWYCNSSNANWICRSQNTSASLTNDVVSAVPVNTSPVVLGVYFPNNSGDCVYFYSTDLVNYQVNNMFVRVSNVYGGSPYIGINKIAGTTLRSMFIDYYGFSIKGFRT